MKENLKDITVVAVCPFCGAETEIAVSASDYFDWMNGELIQNAFPYLSANEREAFVSGICSSCWDKMFSSSEEEEEEDEDFEYDDYAAFDDFFEGL